MSPFLLFDSRYLLFMLPAFIIMLAAQWYVNSTYNKWSRHPSNRRMTGKEVGEHLKRVGQLYDVEIQGVSGNLTDHYDPRRKVLRLSQGVYRGNSIASLAITAHELGHAIQDREDYTPLRFRSLLVPAVNIGSYLGWILILIGIFLRITNLAWLGVFAFSGGLIFSLATIPVELNASARAKRLLTQSGLMVSEEEKRGVNAVLNAAAFTYVAAVFAAALQLLYWVTLVGGMGGRRR